MGMNNCSLLYRPYVLELMFTVGPQCRSKASFQLQTLGFSGGGIRNFLSKENDFRTFRERKSLSAVRKQFSLRESGNSFSQHHIGGNLLPIITMLERYSHREPNKGMCPQCLVDFERSDIDTAANN